MSRSHDHVAVHRVIDALMNKKIRPAEWQSLMQQVAECELCKTEYQKGLRAVRFLVNPENDLAVPSQWELGRIQDVVLEASTHEPSPSRSVWRLFWVPVAGASLVATLVIGYFLFQSPNTEFGVKGIGIGLGDASFSAYCINPNDQTVSEIIPGGACPISHLLQFSYSSTRDRSHLFLFGRQGDTLLWYHPRPPTRTSIGIRPGAQDEVLPGAVKLGVNHVVGDLCIMGIFSKQSIEMEEVMRIASQPTSPGDVFRLCFRVTNE